MSAGANLDPAALIAEGDWLRRLALGLARDRDQADDLVQETYEAALRRPPDAGRPLRPWLAEVLKNRWRMTLRSGGRRVARELVAEAAREAPPTAAHLLERAAILRDLAELVVELAEPLRTALLLRYSEGLSSREIARATGAPEGTVRWRIKQATDRLRDGLDDKRRGSSWRRALLAPVALGPGGVPLVGGWIMKKYVVALVVAAALVGGGLLFLMPRGERADSTAATTAATRPSPPPARPGERAGVPASEWVEPPGLGDRARVADEPTAPGGAFAGRVVNWSTGGGVAGAELTFATDGATTSLVTDASGGFVFRPPGAGRHVLVSALAPGYLPYAPELGASPVILVGRPSRRVDGVAVYLYPAIDYVGVVVDARDAPVVGAVVRMLGAASHEQVLARLPDVFKTDARGEFVFHAPDDTMFEARHPGHGPGRGKLDDQVAITHRMKIALPARGSGPPPGGERLGGRVVDDAGAPIAGARVAVARVMPAMMPKDALWLPPVRLETDDDGRFAVTELERGDYDVAVEDDDHAPALVRAATGASLTVTLAGGVALEGRVHDAAGQAVPAFTVVVQVADGLRRRPLVTRSVVDADGAFAIGHLAPGRYHLVAAARGFAPSVEALVEVTERGPARVDLTLARGAVVTGRVLSRTGEATVPLARARVVAEGGTGGASVAPLNAGTVTDERGEFRLTGLPVGKLSLRVAAADHHIRILGGLIAVEGAALPPIEVVLRPTGPGEAPRVEFVGIGVVVEAGDDAAVISKVVAGGGAEAAGLVAGDHIVAVDGTRVADVGLEAGILLIRGVEGTPVSLLIRRGEAAPFAVTVVRRALAE